MRKPNEADSGQLAHGFVPYARRYCDADDQLHDFTRPFGWIPQADLDQVRDALLTKIPSRAPDRATEEGLSAQGANGGTCAPRRPYGTPSLRHRRSGQHDAGSPARGRE